MKTTDSKLEKLIDDIVCSIDYDIWKDAYNIGTAEEPEMVEHERQVLKFLILNYINDKKVG